MLLILVIAISLSMDTFSLSLAYGTLNMKRKDMISLSTIVGIYHFIMPLVGFYIGSIILKHLPISPETIAFIVLLIIGIEMIIDSFKKDIKVKEMKFLELLMFGLAVSIDSFSIGLGLKEINSKYLIPPFIFALTSSVFTYMGLILGKRISNFIGKISTLIGGITLIIVGVLFIC